MFYLGNSLISLSSPLFLSISPWIAENFNISKVLGIQCTCSPRKLFQWYRCKTKYRYTYTCLMYCYLWNALYRLTCDISLATLPKFVFSKVLHNVLQMFCFVVSEIFLSYLKIVGPLKFLSKCALYIFMCII